MAIKARCPNGHSIDVPEKFAGKRVRCPTCREPFVVAVAKPKETPSGLTGLQLSQKQLTGMIAGWVGSLLLAVLLGAFASRSLGPPIVIESAIVNPASQAPAAPSVPVPNFSSPNASEAGQSMPAAEAQNQAAATRVENEAGSGVRSNALASQPVSTFQQSGRSPTQRLPDTPSVQAETVTTVNMTEPQAIESLKADLQEAIEMLDKGQHQLLVFDFLATKGGIRIPGGPGRTVTIPEKDAAELKAHLQGALSGEFGFNRNHTLAEVTYVRQPVVMVPPGPPQYVPAMDDKPLGKPVGLGSDLSMMLEAAARLLEDGKTEEFIQNVYPYPELARLSEADLMERLLLRISTSPEMKAAMIRDLKAAAAEKATVSGNDAEVKLPPLVARDEPRILKFELVDGNWRFFDGQKESRDMYRQLVTADIPAVTIPGSRGRMVLARSGENWRLSSEPTSEPLQ